MDNACGNTVPGIQIGMGAQVEQITFKRHQELTALAYRVKKFIDSEGGLKYDEGCAFGRYMQEILYLK